MTIEANMGDNLHFQVYQTKLMNWCDPILSEYTDVTPTFCNCHANAFDEIIGILHSGISGVGTLCADLLMEKGYHRWINLQPMSVLSVHVQHEFNSNANTYLNGSISVGFQYVPPEFFSYLMSHLCSMATTFPTDAIWCRVPARRGLQRTALAPGRDETRASDPLVRTYWQTTKNLKKYGPILDLFYSGRMNLARYNM